MNLYKNRDWLYQKYWKEELSSKQIGKLCKVCYETIRGQLIKFNINRRTSSEHQEGEKNSFYHRYHTKKTKVKISERLKGRIFTKEHRRKLSESGKSKVFSKQHRENISKSNKGKIRSLECKRKLSKSTKKLWTNSEYVNKVLKATNRKPTNLEKFFNKITPEIIRYTGNGTWWKKLPNGKNKNPDFKVTGQNKVIEVFGDYWHRNDNPQELIDLYAQVGLDCLVFWEKEIYNNPEQIKEKVDNFIIQ